MFIIINNIILKMTVLTKKMYKTKSRVNARINSKKSKKIMNNMKGGAARSFNSNSQIARMLQTLGVLRKQTEREKVLAAQRKEDELFLHL